MLAVANAISGARPARRRLSRRHRPHRASSSDDASRRRVVVRPGWARVMDRASATTWRIATWEGLVAGPVRRAARSRPSIRRRLTSQMAGEVRDFDASHVLDRKDLRRTDRYIQFGLVAAREAMDKAGLPDRLEGELAEETGRHPRHGPRRRRTRCSTTSRSHRAARPGPHQPVPHPDGHRRTSAPARSRSTSGRPGRTSRRCRRARPAATRIGEASETIRRGDADMMLAGGTEAGMHEALVGGFAAMRALSHPQRRPGGRIAAVRRGPRRLRHRRGRGHAGPRGRSSTPQARGATILAELVGYGATADAFHITLPPPGGIGAVRAARRAHREGRADAGRTSTT